MLRCTPLQGQGRSGGSGYLWCRSYCLGFWDFRFSQFHSRPGVQGEGFHADSKRACRKVPGETLAQQLQLGVFAGSITLPYNDDDAGGGGGDNENDEDDDDDGGGGGAWQWPG